MFLFTATYYCCGISLVVCIFVFSFHRRHSDWRPVRHRTFLVICVAVFAVVVRCAFDHAQSYVLAALNGDNLPEQLRMRRRAYCADSMAFVDTLMDIGDS